MKANPPTEDVLILPGERSVRQAVLTLFLGLSAEQFSEALRSGMSEYAMGFIGMSPAGLRYYLPVVLEYIRSGDSIQDVAGIEVLLVSLKRDYSDDPEDVRALILEIVAFIGAHRRKFRWEDLGEEEELSEESLKIIKDIAERGAQATRKSGA